MDPDLENVIRQALADAQAAGRDHLTQTETAGRAVLKARPDMTASDALAAVNLVRRDRLLHVPPITEFAPSKLSDEDWSVLVSELVGAETIQP